jgi:hypothetical protein
MFLTGLHKLLWNHGFRNDFVFLLTPVRSLKSFTLFLCHSNEKLVRQRQESNRVKNSVTSSYGVFPAGCPKKMSLGKNQIFVHQKYKFRKDASKIRIKICLTLILLTRRIWWAPNNASKWQTWFNSAFEGLIYSIKSEHFALKDKRFQLKGTYYSHYQNPRPTTFLEEWTAPQPVNKNATQASIIYNL